MLSGSRPEFNLDSYDANGELVKSPEQLAKENAKAEEGEKTFMQKYWMYIMGGLLLFNTLTAVAQPEEGGQAK